MIRLLLLILLATFQQSAFAAVFKCELEGGKVGYQASPCEKGREVSVTSPARTSLTDPAAVAPGHGEKKCVGKELSINFQNMPVVTTLRVLADFSGNWLSADSSITGAGAFKYVCVPWDVVLQDIASRHGLAVKVENRTIFATKR